MLFKHNQNFRGRSDYRDNRNRGKYNRGDRRNFKNRNRSFDRGRSRNRDDSRNLGGVQETVDLETVICLTEGTKVIREGVIIAESQDM